MKSLVMVLLLAAGAATGSLVVHSQPGVEVVWDGVPLGTTDARGELTISGILPGTYAVELHRQGLTTARRDLAVHAGPMELELRLVPLGRPPAPEEAVPSPVVTQYSSSSLRDALRPMLLGSIAVATVVALSVAVQRRRQVWRRRHRHPEDLLPPPVLPLEVQPAPAAFVDELLRRERLLRGEVLAPAPPAAPTEDVIEGEVLDREGREA